VWAEAPVIHTHLNPMMIAMQLRRRGVLGVVVGDTTHTNKALHNSLSLYCDTDQRQLLPQ
jgi:hypothetical protein